MLSTAIPDTKEHSLREAFKKVSQAKTKNENYIQITFGSETFIFPHADGMKVIEALNNAEHISRNYYREPIRIHPIDPDNPIQISQVSLDYYRRMKMSHILNVPLDEIPKDLT